MIIVVLLVVSFITILMKLSRIKMRFTRYELHFFSNKMLPALILRRIGIYIFSSLHGRMTRMSVRILHEISIRIKTDDKVHTFVSFFFYSTVSFTHISNESRNKFFPLWPFLKFKFFLPQNGG